MSVAMSGSIIPTPWRARPRARPRPCLGHLGDGVGGHDRPSGGQRVPAGEGPRQATEMGPDLIHRVAPSDHPGRRQQHVPGSAWRGGDASHDLVRVGLTSRAVGDVGVLGDDGERPQASVGHMAPTHGHAGAGEARQ